MVLVIFSYGDGYGSCCSCDGDSNNHGYGVCLSDSYGGGKKFWNHTNGGVQWCRVTLGGDKVSMLPIHTHTNP